MREYIHGGYTDDPIHMERLAMNDSTRDYVSSNHVLGAALLTLTAEDRNVPPNIEAQLEYRER